MPFKKLLLLFLPFMILMDAYAQTLMPIPGQSATYGGSSRGLYFTAPVDFTITSLRVPTDAAPGAQSVQVVRFTPPFTPGSSISNFTVLARHVNIATTTPISVNIPVRQGEVIGVLGTRINANGNADVNSYASGPYTSNIAGNSVVLRRMGMPRGRLSQVIPSSVFAMSGRGNFSRVEISYRSGITPPAGPQQVPANALWALLLLTASIGYLGYRRRKS